MSAKFLQSLFSSPATGSPSPIATFSGSTDYSTTSWNARPGLGYATIPPPSSQSSEFGAEAARGRTFDSSGAEQPSTQEGILGQAPEEQESWDENPTETPRDDTTAQSEAPAAEVQGEESFANSTAEEASSLPAAVTEEGITSEIETGTEAVEDTAGAAAETSSAAGPLAGIVVASSILSSGISNLTTGIANTNNAIAAANVRQDLASGQFGNFTGSAGYATYNDSRYAQSNEYNTRWDNISSIAGPAGHLVAGIGNLIAGTHTGGFSGYTVASSSGELVDPTTSAESTSTLSIT